jgi:hypothetical protein
MVPNRIVVSVLGIVALKLLMDHRNKSYSGKYVPGYSYDNISAMKHDLFKVLVVEGFILLAYGLGQGEPFFSTENVWNSWVGKTFVIMGGYMVYHEIVQPYILVNTKKW